MTWQQKEHRLVEISAMLDGLEQKMAHNRNEEYFINRGSNRKK
jgi:hypothetical protein